MSVLSKLTEGITERSLRKEGATLVNKWARTGLLEGLGNDNNQNNMARLLENQAKELLREATTMASGDVEGFAAVAFPIVRRVFGGLLAQDIVSVQPMSLPSGLIFFLDFTYDGAVRLGSTATSGSVYGGGVKGNQLTGGISDLTEEGGGFYNMANAYSSPTGSITLAAADTSCTSYAELDSGLTDAIPCWTTVGTGLGTSFNGTEKQIDALTEAQKTALQWDVDLIVGGGSNALTTDDVVEVLVKMNLATANKMNFNHMGAFTITGMNANVDMVIRRLTHLGLKGTDGVTLTYDDPSAATCVITFYVSGTGLTAALADDTAQPTLVFPYKDQFEAGDGLGSVQGANLWPLELATNAAQTASNGEGTKDLIPEINLQVNSVAVSAVTKKLKAKWSPELGQDLNAYHNLDAEVELTSILSEHIALEIDQEILSDLIKDASAGTYFWSRSPGLFVNRTTGAELGAASAAPDFTGTVSEWYETLIETINDVSAQIHRKLLRGGANFLVTSPEIANILEFTSGFRANITMDENKGTVGAVNVGSISKKFDVYVDPYFQRNLILVGRKGSSFLESGYVYAPYVPLQVTPTIFGAEDFVPRKGVMTRYAKKMVKPDMYGLVVVRGLLGEAGAS